MLTFVRGSSFQMAGRFLLDSKTANCTNWSTPRVVLATFDGSDVFAELTFEWLDQLTGQGRVYAGDTSDWPVGRARIDAQITDGFGNTYNAVCDYLRIVESMLNKVPSGVSL
jgi:hypothetical protein